MSLPKQIGELDNSLTGAQVSPTTDELPIADASDGGKAKRITVEELFKAASTITTTTGNFTTVNADTVNATTKVVTPVVDSGTGSLVLKGAGTTSQTITGANTVYSGTITPTQTGGIIGTTTNNNTAAGSIGEYIESVVAGVSFPTSGQFGDATSITLTAGDWDVSLVGYTVANGGTVTAIILGISQTTGNSSSGLVLGSNEIVITPPVAANDNSDSIPSYRQSLSGTTIIYAKMSANYTVATPKISARLSARRMR